MIKQETFLMAADWWAEQITTHKRNWDNGAQNEGSPEDRRIGLQMWMMGNMLAQQCRELITPEQIKIFRDSIIRQLKEAYDIHESHHGPISNSEDYPTLILSVDYGLGKYLYEAAKESGINPNAFPCKTTMWINGNSIEAELGYGSDIKKLI